jgi:hypothetical protein
LDVIDVLKANATIEELLPIWLAEAQRADHYKRGTWLRYGLWLGCLSNVPERQLAKLCPEGPLQISVLDALLRARRTELLEQSDQTFLDATEGVLARDIRAPTASHCQGLLDTLVQSLDASRYAMAFAVPHAESQSLATIWRRRGASVSELKAPARILNEDDRRRKCCEFIEKALEQAQQPASQWATELGPWESLIEKGRSL